MTLLDGNCGVGRPRRRLRSSRAALAQGRGLVKASINRRKRNGYSDAVTPEFPEGTVDPDLHVVRIDGLDGTPLAVVTAYACHPVALRPPSHAISADFVCALRRDRGVASRARPCSLPKARPGTWCQSALRWKWRNGLR